MQWGSAPECLDLSATEYDPHAGLPNEGGCKVSEKLLSVQSSARLPKFWFIDAPGMGRTTW